ncbi:outer dense fiber protein 2 [Rhinatrema bivittatum]|uniref:outer dense fiber protein 2 n=1 Tax=Rhinatrema bivittatum TaxID=194408 RepID=UPI00112B062F|nr:outer dense fiber protein 2 [Rhinatrema bivittatum]
MEILEKRRMKNRSPSPPLHVHVSEKTAVHVHIKKNQKSPAKCQFKSIKNRMKGETKALRQSVKVKTKAPWIPPGKTHARNKAYIWEGQTHRLEITPPDPEKMISSLHLSDLSTDEEDAVRCKFNSYEKKISALMSEVGRPKSEVELQKKDHKGDLAEVALELTEMENENTRLRRSIDRIKGKKEFAILIKKFNKKEKDKLLTKLVEAEMDGTSAAKIVTELRETICRLRSEKRMTCTDINLLTRQKEILLQKLNTFEETNRTLRHLLRDRHSQESETQRLVEQKELLLKKLSDSDAERTHFQKKLHEKEKELDDLLIQLKSEKEVSRTASEFSKSLETTRAHLHGQLRNREAESNRLSVQLRNLERSNTQQKVEVDQLHERLNDQKQRTEKEKEALKKATREQKQRAEHSENTLEKLTMQLQEKDTHLVESLTALEASKSRLNKVLNEKNQMDTDNAILSKRVSELLEERKISEEKARSELEALKDKLHVQISDNTLVKMEQDKLKANLTAMEEKLTLAHGEAQQLKVSLKQYEGLVDSYKSQMQKTRIEADDMCSQLEKCSKENRTLKDSMKREVDQIRKNFSSRLADLEQLPELLKITESKLQECQNRLVDYEMKNKELTSMIADLRVRMEQQGDKMEITRDRYQSAAEENKHLLVKLEELERKLEEAGTQNRELVQIIAKREESIHQNQLCLEEKTRESMHLARQLDLAIEDGRRQVEQARARATSKERTAQSKVLDLETQLSRTKTELNQLRRSKEDAEHRFQSRLQDVKDRLEQSESTNRSMQNYVHFLKSSYANVFGESMLSSSPIRPRTPL